MIADMHCDTLSELLNRRKSGSAEGLRRNSLCLDLERMRGHSYLLQNFAIFIDLARTKEPFSDALEQAELFHEEMRKNRDIAGVVTSWEEMEQNRKEGKLSAMLTLEDDDPVLEL